MDVRAAIAVDWSGARADGRRRTWLAEVVDDRLVALGNGWTVDSLAGRLVERAATDPHLVLGLDFAFCFPSWFVASRFSGSAAVAWERALAEGEAWLRSVESPFWGRAPGLRRPAAVSGCPPLRATEMAVAGVHGRPKSVFQVGGAGSVGTGSIRGMPLLARLRAAGFAIWPFDGAATPLVVEIYPRALTGPVVKSSATERARYLDERLGGWPYDPALRAKVVGSEDAFDAAVSALQMWRHAEEFSALPAVSEEERVEGRIWCPSPPPPGWQRTWDSASPLPEEWTAAADDWIAWARAPGHDSYWRFHRDAFLEMLPPAPGEVLDLGCGEGRLSRDLSARGYTVTGVDVAPPMIDAARQLDPQGRYRVADALATGLPDASVDAVAAFMSLQDVEDLEGAIAESARVLRRDGHLCIAIVHPLNSAGGFESGDPGAAFRIVRPYLEARTYVDEGVRAGLRMRFASWHRPIGAYFAALEQHGFVVDRVREVTVDAASAGARRDRERWLGMPLFLHLRALRATAPRR